MTTRVIDSAKCIGCGKCVNDCINRYLELVENVDGKKKASFKVNGRCIECGHCNAICPQGAIEGGNVVTEIDKNDTLLRLMATKRSVRQYDKRHEIEQEVLDKIILAGQSAPTDRNRKSARILLIKQSLPEIYNKALDWLVEEVERTGRINPLYVPTMALNAKRDEVLWNAEYLVAFVGLSSSMIDAAIAAERMQLEASSLGVGTCYRGDMKNAFNNVEELREILGIRKNEECLVTFAMGYTPLHYVKPAIKCNRKVEYR